MLLLVRQQWTGQLHEQRAGEADDGVQRRAQFMAHRGQKAIFRLTRAGQGLIGIRQLDVLLLQGPLEAFPFGDVADRAAHQHTVFGFDGAVADFDWELGAVGTVAEEVVRAV